MFWQKLFKRLQRSKSIIPTINVHNPAKFMQYFTSNRIYNYIRKDRSWQRCEVCGFPANTYKGEIPLCTHHEGHDAAGNLVAVWW